jgi:hypothetical protein
MEKYKDYVKKSQGTKSALHDVKNWSTSKMRQEMAKKALCHSIAHCIDLMI